MKKILILLFFTLLVFFALNFISYSPVFACQYDNTCNEAEFDCSKTIGMIVENNKNGCLIYSQCQTPGNCCAEVRWVSPDWFTLCFLKKGQPAPPPCNEGTEGCQCRSSYPLCNSGLNPIGSNTSCICSTLKTFPTPPSGNVGIKPTICKQGEPGEGIMTALGCIPTKDTTQFVAWLLKFAIGIGGGIAMLLIIFGAFQVITSSGNPEKLKKGTDMITAAISGLLFIIFSLFLLKLIGVDILKLPNFGK